MSALPGLTRVKCRVSAVIGASVETTWDILRLWTNLSDFFCAVDGRELHTELVAGEPTQVGSMRCIRIGTGQMFEQLVGLDDVDHVLRWKVVSHPGTVNPFNDASFVNYIATIRLHPITVGNTTYIDWTGQACTENAFAGALQAKLENWYEAGIRSLQAYLQQRQLAATAQPAVAHGIATPGQPGSASLSAGNAFLFQAGSLANGQQAPAQTGPVTAMDVTAAAFSAGLPAPVTAWSARGMQAPQPDLQRFGSLHGTQAPNPAAPLPSQQPMPIGAMSGQQRPAQTPSLAGLTAGLQTPAFSAGGLQGQGLATGAQIPLTGGQVLMSGDVHLQRAAAAAALSSAHMTSQVPQAQAFIPGAQAPTPGAVHLQRAAAAAAFSAAQFSSQVPQAQAYPHLPNDLPQGNAPQPGLVQTQAAFLAESLRRTRLSQDRRSQMTNVPSFSDGLQALYDQADAAKAVAANRGWQSGQGFEYNTPAGTPKSHFSDPGPRTASAPATSYKVGEAAAQGGPWGHTPGGFGSLTLLTEAEQTALRGALRTEAAQQGRMPPPESAPANPQAPRGDYKKTPIANAFANAPPRSTNAKPSPWAMADAALAHAQDVNLPISTQSTPEGPAPPASDSNATSSNITMSWSNGWSSGPARTVSSSQKSSRTSMGSQSMHDSGGSKSSEDGSGGCKSMHNLSNSADDIDSRISSLDSDKSTTEEGVSQAGKRSSFEFDRPRKVLGRRSFDEAIDPHPGQTNSKSQRTGGDDEAWHSNDSSSDPAEVQPEEPDASIREKNVAVKPQELTRFSPFATSGSQASSQSTGSSDKSSQSSQKRVGLSQLSPFAKAM